MLLISYHGSLVGILRVQMSEQMLGSSALTSTSYLQGRSSVWAFVGAADSQASG